MKIHPIYEFHLAADTLTVLFVTEANSAALSARVGATLAAKKGKKQFIAAGVIALGLGDAPTTENFRTATCDAVNLANEYQFSKLTLLAGDLAAAEQVAIAESAALSNYQFLLYKTKKEAYTLQEVAIYGAEPAAVAQGQKIAEATAIARDLVNEPVITLTATVYAERIEELGKTYGFEVEVFNKARILALKMGGLLGVNAGSQEPPTFTVMEYKPENAKNSQPIVLVGKGVVFDTGGLSLKPTANSMDYMKCDMGGSAAIVGAFVGAALLKLPVHIIGLIPATDNRPGENAIVPSDIITMYDGTTVEVLNTDAEGRLILADALGYAKQFNPELVIDLATLTGASVVAIGSPGSAMMSNASEETKAALKACGEAVYERLVELPLWAEYGEMIKSDVADLKNLGGPEGGAITAGKFLEHFTAYPWIHLDIAAGAFTHKPSSYRGKGGTGLGTRLLIDFLSKR